MSGADGLEVLIVSLGSTAGLRAADEELRASLERCGARAAIVRARAPRPVRTLALTDLAWARATRAQVALALRADTRARPPCLIYSTTTAALLWPLAGAIRFDSTAAANRPGRHGVWQRPLERKRLREAPLLLPWSEGSLDGLSPLETVHGRALVVPVPVEPSATGAWRAPAAAREIAALTYAANPRKKGLDRVLAAWRRVRSELPSLAGQELVVAGASARDLRAAGLEGGEDGVRVVGVLAHEAYRALLRRARVFVCAPRREDYGIAQLEALADGCVLVTTPAPGPYAALPLARALDTRLVADDLTAALRAAFERPPTDYAERAHEALAPFTRAAVDGVVARELLPRLAASARLS
ncbi:MAG TPA: glycosyltransferase [Solirubrobacteraceae bacterium]|nr:glycosyltransferase [Solirubrobacteraceae bacterium]